MPERFHWSQVESADYRKYVANLRSIGCPAKTIADIITADVNQMYRDKASKLRKDILATNAFEYWRSPAYYATRPSAADAYRRELRELNRQRVALLQSLLEETVPADDLAWAPAAPAEASRKRAYEAALELLEPEKRERVRQLADEATERMRAVVKANAGSGDGTHVTLELQRISNEADKAYKAILTPAEKELFDLYRSSVAARMREEFDGLDVSEAEFRSIFQRRKEVDDAHNLVSANSPVEEIQKQLAATDQAEQQLAQTLGPERYAEYKRLQDKAYQEMLRLTTTLELPKDTAVLIYDLKTSAENRASAVRQDPGLSVEQRQEALRQLRANTEQAVKNAVGGRAAVVTDDRASRWIRNLETLNPPPQQANKTILIPSR